MSSSPFPVDDAFCRSYALDLILPLRNLITYERREALFAQAVIFYRWYFSHYEDESELERYMETFDLVHPATVKLEPVLREACFIEWFIGNGYHHIPVPKKKRRTND